MSQDQQELQIILSRAPHDDPAKSMLAIGMGLAALTTGARVYLFLATDAAPIGTPTGVEGIQARGFTDSLDSYIEDFISLGGKIEICASCYQEYCAHLPKDDRGNPLLREGAEVAGMSIAAERCLTMRTITF